MDDLDRITWGTLKAVAVGFGIAVCIGAAAFATGQTFGQRCAAVYSDPFDIDDCVHRLDGGGPLRSATPAPGK